MDKKKMIYISLLLILTVFVSVNYFSYAFFTHKDEQHGKLNVVAGTLNYQLKSSLLTSNAITLASKEKARLNLEIESLNEINSKYELYYTTTNNGIEIGYTTVNDNPTGTINAKAKKIVTVVIKNKTNASATVTFGIQGGFTGNNLTLDTGRSSISQYQNNYCEVATNTVYSFDYNGTDGTDGSSQEFNVGCTGNYKIETWGAQGGNSGGAGGYTSGNIGLNDNTQLYVYVGGAGGATPRALYQPTSGGYNGGGGSDGQDCCNRSFGTGGGATDIRLVGGSWDNFNSLKSRIMVAGAGGGKFDDLASVSYGGAAGGLIGGNASGDFDDWCPGFGGTQTSGGTIGVSSGTYCQASTYAEYTDPGLVNGGFGTGGKHGTQGNSSSGGGAGYYGGGSSGHIASAAGGSSFISGYYGCNAIAESSTSSNIVHTNQPNHYSGKIFTSSVMIDGNGCNWSTGVAANCGTNQPQPNGTNAVGHTGNGYARITYLSENVKEEKAKINYIITFNANGGSSTATKNVKAGTAIGILPIAKKETGSFDGWYLESTLTTKIDATYVPTGNTTLYAKWN